MFGKFSIFNFQFLKLTGSRKLVTGNLKSNGFTLVEIMVGLIIASVMFLAGYAAYQDYARRQILENASEELKSSLVFTRQKALSGENASVCNVLGDTLQGYQLNFQAGSYTISPKCVNLNPGASNTQTVTFPTNVTLGISGFSNPLIYNTVSGTNLAGTATLTLTFTPSGATKVITINTQGVIQ